MGHPQSRYPQAIWDSAYEAMPLAYDPSSLRFAPLLRELLPGGGSAFEVGCYPGDYLIFLARELGYRPCGIDVTPFVETRLPERLAEQGIAEHGLVRGSFFELDGAEQHDVVCSFGFVEHFDDVEDVLARHVRLVRPGGWLVVTCPNFRGLQHGLHWLLDRENLGRHVLPAMDLDRWARALTAQGMTLVRHGYEGTFEFWAETPPAGEVGLYAVRILQGVAARVERGRPHPNRWTSPYLVSVSRKAA